MGTPRGITPVENFQLKEYLGKWYEIARLDHSFERGLSRVTAEYSLRDDGGVRVINRGYDRKSEEWSQAEGRAYFVSGPDTGHLKVSFFGPFYGSYVVFELDRQDYRYAYVTGNTKDYLWFLSRTARVSEERKETFRKKADELGFATEEIIFVQH